MDNKDRKTNLAEEASSNILGPNPVIGLNKNAILKIAKTLVTDGISYPQKTVKHQLSFLKEFLNILRDKSALQPEEKDRRFKEKAWQENFFHKSSLQTYLAFVKEMDDWIEDLNLNKLDEDRSKFVVSLLTEAVAPSNWITNPSALKKLIDTGGSSWVKGAKNMLHDILNNGGFPSKVDTEGFQVGINLGITKGSVVFKSDVLELIQYQPTTDKVYHRPFLMVPPQINKFYLLDISPGKSLVEFMVNQGFQVFVISWFNPTKEQSMWDLETYVMAIEEAIAAIKNICKTKDLNVWGACSGGITLSTTLAYLNAKKDKSIHAASFVVSILDMSNATDTTASLFADNMSIELARKNSQRKGILKGSEMEAVFSLMRPNDLIWNYWVNNYLHGNKPPKYDILFWNGDTTNLPAGLHSDYLDLFKENYLAKKNAFKISKYPIDLSTVNCDLYFVAGLTDHITPWKICFDSMKIFDTNSTFVLGNKGHIQTILNPPGNKKGKFFINDNCDCRNMNHEEWLANATPHPESWWFHFSEWLQKRSGKQKNAPKQLGSKSHQPLYDAPGKYVFN